MKIPLNIYAESTPNPHAMKFVVNRMLIDGNKDYPDVSTSNDSPFIRNLFSFSFVRSVFVAGNYVTVLKDPNIEWDELIQILKEFIKAELTEDIIFTSDKSKTTTTTEDVVEIISGNNEVEDKIIQALDEYVRPAVESDGGAIKFKSFISGTVTVELQGACSGCPSSTLTLKSGIENLLKSMIPEVKEVISESEMH